MALKRVVRSANWRIRADRPVLSSRMEIAEMRRKFQRMSQ